VDTQINNAPKLKTSLKLKNVSFGYGDAASLKNLNLEISAHKTTAIMGPSGAGKSTFADIIMGLLSPDQGQILVDDTPLDASNIMAWRRSIAYVSQDIFLFHDSIRNNLLWAKEDATEAELFDALDKASATFVSTIPEGLDTIVGDGGVRLSGGERQRIALAGAMLQDPEILILDEATSALDMENEAKIVDAIENLHGALTMIVIGHRLPTLEHADKVIVLDNGEISQSGSWSEINRAKGI
jgi:ATP-binding cassette subfamily C protein